MTKSFSFFSLLTAHLFFLPIQNSPLLSPALTKQLNEKPTYKAFNLPRHAIQSLLNQAQTTRAKSTHLPADISFICADIKYNDGIVKFCECGNAVYMSPTSTAQLTIDNTPYTVTAPYWGIFWHYLKQFNLPIFFVGKPKNPIVFALEELRKLGGYVCSSLEELETHLKPASSTTTRTDDIKSYQGIVVYYSKDPRYRDGSEIAAFKKKHPELLYVSYPAHSIVSKKTLTYQLFEHAGLADFLPKTKLYPKTWHDDLIPDILRSFSCARLIIKPTSLSCSSGIQVTTRDNIYDVLHKGLRGSPRQKYNLGFNYWHNQTHFMVSEYVQSETIYVDDKPYDPTMRAVCALHHSNGIISCLPIGCFWKIPTHSLDDKASLNDKHITRAHLVYPNPDVYFSGIPVDHTNESIIKKTLHTMMPQLYETLLSKQAKK